ncbi:MAG: GH116 family glycosyl-hydrolase [Candidatus Moduliflexus flocculans]|nr:GH116 family glycosyl-hydrolase [Candidatus Moduliflexus flocculans]
MRDKPGRNLAITAMFLGLVSLGTPVLLAADIWRADWPVLRTYDRDHVERIALPLGGIGTGTVSLGGRGNLVDWEIMNRPAKGYVPYSGQQTGPFFAVHVGRRGGRFTRALEGPLPLVRLRGLARLDGRQPRPAPVPGRRLRGRLPARPGPAVRSRTRRSTSASRPGTRSSRAMPRPAASRSPSSATSLVNKTARPLRASVCGTLPNFIGADGSELGRDWKSDPVTTGPKKNRNEFRSTGAPARHLHAPRAASIPGTRPGARSPWPRRPRTRGSSRTSWLAAGLGHVAPRLLGRLRGRRRPRSPAGGGRGHALRLADRGARRARRRQRRGGLLS